MLAVFSLKYWSCFSGSLYAEYFLQYPGHPEYYAARL